MSNLGLGKKIWGHCPYQEKPKREGKRLKTVAVEQRGQAVYFTIYNWRGK